MRNPQSWVSGTYSFASGCSSLLIGEDKVLFSEDSLGFLDISLTLGQDVFALEQRCSCHVTEEADLLARNLAERSPEDSEHRLITTTSKSVKILIGMAATGNFLNYFW
jgi:hypothetical protein